MTDERTMRIGVLGAGVMGSGIAQVTALAGFPTVVYDPDAGALERGRAGVATGRYGLASAVERGKVSADDAAAAQARLTFSSSFDEAATTDLVIEAVPEDLAMKVRVFRQLDSVAPPATILASNTSGFPISALAAATNRPDRVIGWHWASPAPVMRLAEIVRTPATSDATVATVEEAARACDKNPVVVNDSPMVWGFVANRIYGAMLREARQVVEDGVATPEQIDTLLVDCFRWPVGPFTMVGGARSGWKE